MEGIGLNHGDSPSDPPAASWMRAAGSWVQKYKSFVVLLTREISLISHEGQPSRASFEIAKGPNMGQQVADIR